MTMTMFTLDSKISPEDLSAPAFSEGAVELVRHGYTERTRCLGFRVDLYAGKGAAEALRAVGPYNNFEPNNVLQALRALAEQGQLSTRIEVGRESSPVLYLYLTRDADETRVTRLLRDALADEVDISRGGFHATVRAWWD